MSKKKLIKQLKEKNPPLNQSEIETVINTFSQNITETLKKGNSVEIRGFGTFSKKYIRPRKFKNPKTKEVSYLGETATMHFKPSKSLIEK